MSPYWRALFLKIRLACPVVAAICLCSSPLRAVIATGPQGSALADPSEWGSALLINVGSAYCSSIVVGPQVLLTAAHCMSTQRNELNATIEAVEGRLNYRMVCATDPRYPAVASADLALCKTDRPLPVTRLERIVRQLPSPGTRITLVGYGCRDGAVRNFDGRVSAAEAIIQAGVRSSSDGYITTSGAAACAGDGGGGVFFGSDEGRVLVGIISRTDATSRTLIANLTAEPFLNWAIRWSGEQNVLICGLIDEGSACRARPQDAPAAASADTPPTRDAAVLLARPTSAPSIVASTQLGRSSSNDVQLRQVFYRKGEVLAAVVQISCYGTADDAYLTRVLNHLESAGSPLARDHVFPSSGTLAVPVCPPSTGGTIETVTVSVAKDGSKRLWDYFLRLVADKKLGERWWFEYRELDGPRQSPPGPNSRYFVDVFRELNPSQDPKALTVGQITLPLRPRTVSVTDEPAANVETLEPFSAVASADEVCSQAQDALTYPFDLVGLIDALAANTRQRSEAALEAARIVVLDSGLYTSRREETVFRRSLYVDRPGVGQVFKKEFLSRTEPRLPQASKAVHGTQVASVALGGYLFSRIQASSAESPKIRIDPYRLHESRGGMVIMPADKFPDIFRDLNPRGTTIVNLKSRHTEHSQSGV